MSERDYANNPEDDPYYQPQQSTYGPDPDWNGGVAPGAPAPRYDYNGGSPPDQALTPGHGWTWQGPQEQTWNADLGQWDRGVWQETSGSGLGYNAPAPAYTPSGGGGGSVPPIGGGGGGSRINIPGAGLPQNILDLFNRQPQQTPIQSAYQDALLKYMNRGFETPSLNDSILGPQTEVFRAANQRNTERQRRTAVERAGAGQAQSGYLDNVINEGVQKQGFNNAQFNANLLGGEMNKRREELQAALQMAAVTGNQEATRELQSRLAQVSAAMQQQGLNLQGQLGMGDLDLRWALGSEGLNQNALQMIMGGG